MNKEKENIDLEENLKSENEEAAEVNEDLKAQTAAADSESEAASESETAGNEGIQLELSREELIEELREKNEKIAAMDAEIDDLLSRLQRLQADFVNYRKRSEKEKAEMTTRGKAQLCSSLLPVIDNFERALKAEDQENDFYRGVEMIYNQLVKSFADAGIKEIAAQGEEFNPEYHEAIMRVETDEYEEGTVTEVVQKGFVLEDRVIRPAMVKVAG
jgi:molecular chaperone GrpE